MEQGNGEIDEISLSEVDKLESYYDRNEPVIINAKVGSGVVNKVEQFAEKIAERKGREFVNWKEVKGEEKIDILSNLNKYFFLSIIRGRDYPPEFYDTLHHMSVVEGTGITMITEIHIFPEEIQDQIVSQVLESENPDNFFVITKSE